MHIQGDIKNLILSVFPILDGEKITVKQTEDSAHGDFSTAIALESFKLIKKEGNLNEISSPLAFAEFLAGKINDNKPEWLEKVEAAAPGFLNFYLNKSNFASSVLNKALNKDFAAYSDTFKTKIIVEHTSVNPNKAMHIGHIRNAFIGDTIVRVLKKFNYNVEVHNYIDDTGLQVADTTLAVMSLNKIKPENQSFADFAWDIYSEINKLYETDKSFLEKRELISKDIEHGEGEIFEKSQEIVAKILEDHLDLMCQLGIRYDLLVYESDIVKGGFWKTAFEKLKSSPNFYLETEGKQAGCWVLKYKSEKFGNKVFVRGNGTVVYTGKDLAYHMWKFGVLGKDFSYLPSHYLGYALTRTSCKGVTNNDKGYGKANSIITVVDERQEYPQEMVRYGLEALGYTDEYNNYKHLSYGVVNLSAATGRALGIDVSGDSSVAMSGRKGVGVKARDLIKLLEVKIRETSESDQAFSIAIGAIKHYMLKYNPSSEIIFDYESALNLKGNTGPYLQYSYARARGIINKIESGGLNYSKDIAVDSATYELIKLMAEWSDILEKVSKDYVLSYISDYAFRLSSAFHKFYESNNVMKSEGNIRAFRISVVKAYLNTIEDVLSVMGIEAVDKM
jgi:arginyl-tRNA synthetase